MKRMSILPSTISFVAFKGISPLSRLIRFWTRSPYSHIAFILNKPEMVLVESWKTYNGFCWGISSLGNHRKGTPYEIWEKQIEEDKAVKLRKIFLDFAKKQIPFDLKGIMGFVFKHKDDKKKMFCSEGCSIAMMKAGIWPEIEAWRIYPGYFVDLLKVNGFYKAKEGKT